MVKKDYKNTNLWRAKNRVRQLAQANFSKGDKFITLTFGHVDFDTTNIKVCNQKYSLFVRRLARKFKNLKYIAVLEFQKRGAVHYHLLTNIDYILKPELAKLWGHGFVQINRVESFNHIVRYISKYMMKYADDERFIKHRRYFCSTNLKRPKKLERFEARHYLDKVREANLKPYYYFHYSSEFNGLIAVEKYNLDDLSAQKGKS